MQQVYQALRLSAIARQRIGLAFQDLTTRKCSRLVADAVDARAGTIPERRQEAL